MTVLRGHLSRAVSALVVLAAAGIGSAQEMPSPRQMSGVPLPAGDVPPGTVTVRVIRGTFANPISSQTVEIVGTGSPVTASTNDIGRAEFKGLAPGARVKAAATVAGERIESQEFVVPRTGGIRLILVASGGEPAATTPGTAPAPPAAAATPAQPGTVVLGDESRFVFEMGEDGLSVFYVLQVQNAASAPVQPESPLIFDLPADARSATVLEGSSPQAKVAGRRLQIDGPFAPGATNVQLAYTMPFKGSELAIEQKLPAQLMHLAVVAQKVGEMRLASPQLAEQRDMPAQGNLYIAGRGGAVAAGDTLHFQFSGMPHHATWPRNLAIALALVVLGGGSWAAWRTGGAQARQSAERQALEANRERLFAELTALEVRHKSDAIDPARYAERRRELIAALERVYLALDDEVAIGRAS